MLFLVSHSWTLVGRAAAEPCGLVDQGDSGRVVSRRPFPTWGVQDPFRRLGAHPARRPVRRTMKRHAATLVSLCAYAVGTGRAGFIHAQDTSFGQCKAARTTVRWGAAKIRSLYVPLQDRTRIALNVILPSQLPAATRIPAVFIPTRYWRSPEGQPPTWQEESWVNHGYAVVVMDLRGTGASFGTWVYPWSDQEIRDIAEIVDWITKQPWSSGKIVSTGVSYLANTSELVALSNNPAVKAIAPRSSDFDMFDDLVFPNGVPNLSVIRDWGDIIYNLDHNIGRYGGTLKVRPVDADRDKKSLAAAIRSHESNPRLADAALKVVFRDDRPPEWKASFDDFGSFGRQAAMERSKVPIYAWAGWQDAGVVYGQLKRYTTFSNLQRLVIGPWNHGINQHTDPFLSQSTPVVPDTLTQYGDQYGEMLCFFDQFVNGNDNGFGQRLVTYYTLNEGKWKTTKEWPVPGAVRTRWYLGAEHRLSSTPPAGRSGSDRYVVDFEHTTGKQNRWWTQIGGGDPKYRGDVFYLDRTELTRRLLTYTSEPLRHDIEVTGHPIVRLHASVTTNDGAIYVYLEDVDSAGRVTYLTEGQMRLIHRKMSTDPPPYTVQVPYHSLKRKDSLGVVPGQTMEITFGLLPTSVLLRRGHRIRIAIAGADSETFSRLPATGSPAITVERNARYPSYIELPVFERR